MKTLSAILFLLATPLVAFSQSVISNVVPNFGDQFEYGNNEAAPSTGDAGANITWDFSNLNVGIITDNVVMSPDEVEGSEDYPNATMAYVVNEAGLSIASYFGTDNNIFSAHGSKAEFGGFASGVMYTDPVDNFTYPMGYQDTGSDTYGGSLIGVDGLITGTQSYIVDGWGTLITPYGTYPNVLRLTETFNENIITVLLVETSRTTTSWYSPNIPIPLMVITSDFSSAAGIPLDSSQTMSVLVSYTPASTTSLDDRNNQNVFQIFPNPVHDQITVTFDSERSDAVLNIYAATGKLVESVSVISDQKVDVTGLAPGMYIAVLSVDGQRYAQTKITIIQ